jgi:hypothetical protein
MPASVRFGRHCISGVVVFGIQNLVSPVIAPLVAGHESAVMLDLD